jgi:hypothetical protein
MIIELPKQAAGSRHEGLTVDGREGDLECRGNRKNEPN